MESVKQGTGWATGPGLGFLPLDPLQLGQPSVYDSEDRGSHREC